MEELVLQDAAENPGEEFFWDRALVGEHISIMQRLKNDLERLEEEIATIHRR